jgi:simple sugar transport system ATP-binding protein
MNAQADDVVVLESISKRFGDVVANEAIDFSLQRGSVHALVGENGAGKTTLMNVLYGLYQPDSGQIYLDGDPVDFASPDDAIEADIAMIHQHFMLVDNMTVLQNVVLGQEPERRLGVVDVESAREEIERISGEFGFDVAAYLDARIEEVGVGVKQRIEILKTLFRGAEIIIFDEPTAVLTPQEVQQLFEIMRELTGQGYSLIFITHKLDEAMNIADEITVLRNGELIGTVDSEATSRRELARMMVGRDVLFDIDKPPEEAGREVLAVADLEVTDDRGLASLRGVDLEVRAGEILGIAGVEGNGQTELVEAITGLRTPAAGTVRFNDEDVTGASRRELIQKGMALIPEDRNERALVGSYDLVKNGLLGNQRLSGFTRGRLLDWDATAEHAHEIVREYDVQPADVAASATSLSGGNQQKFIVGREITREPDLMVAAHPTRGVDVGSIEFIRERLLELREGGTAILLVSSKLDELQLLSDRIAVMADGDIADVVDPAAVTEEELGLLMGGRNPAEAGSE